MISRPVNLEDLTKFCADAQSMIGPATQKTIEHSKPGAKFTRIYASRSENQRSAFCFIDMETGKVYKAAGWKGPAKHARGSIFGSNPDEWGITEFGARYL